MRQSSPGRQDRRISNFISRRSAIPARLPGKRPMLTKPDPFPGFLHRLFPLPSQQAGRPHYPCRSLPIRLAPPKIAPEFTSPPTHDRADMLFAVS